LNYFKKNKTITLNNKKYKIIKFLGEGGNSVVLEIENNLKEKFAVKLLTKIQGNKSKIERFKIEQEISSKIIHKNIIRIKDKGIYKCNKEDIHFCILPLYKFSLKSYLKNKINDNDKLCIIKNILEGLNVMHKNNIYHRDLKPENILINDLNDIVIADFGIASISNSNLFISKNITRKNERMCNFLYCSPEQKIKNNNKVKDKSDIYSMGLIINEMFTGNIIEGTNFYKIFDKFSSNDSNLKFLDFIVDNMIKSKINERFNITDTLNEFDKFIKMINVNKYYIPKYLKLSFSDKLKVGDDIFYSNHFFEEYKGKVSCTNQKLFIHSLEINNINEIFSNIVKVYNDCSSLKFSYIKPLKKLFVLSFCGANIKTIDIFNLNNKKLDKKSLTNEILFSKYIPKIYKKRSINGLFIDIFDFDFVEKKYYKNIYYLYQNEVFYINKVQLTKNTFNKSIK
tara:strand:- start:12675 stop:14036 length:1362 start_codon:yes stop_codon:yes gene_type:complete